MKATSFTPFLNEVVRPSLVESLIPERSLTLFTGARESGKTILALLLAQGVAARYAFLGQQCKPFAVAFFDRYGTKVELWRLAQRVAPRLMTFDEERMSVYGCWEPEDTIPELDDPLFETLAASQRFLVFDGIPDPKQTKENNPEEFLRKWQLLARKCPGVAMFGSVEWRKIQPIRNRVDVHLPISKELDRITVEVPKTGRKGHLDLPHKDSYPFQIGFSVE